MPVTAPMTERTHRILIVDDDRDTLVNLSDILTDMGYETDTAGTGEDAIDKVEEQRPSEKDCQYDVCLLDFKMPGMDGVELYKRILAHDPGIRAIMITAFAGEDGIRRAREAGTWKVLRKPVDIKVLLAMIREATS